METYDVIVIGGGVTGTSIAYHLTKNYGLKVILLERHFVAQANTSLAAGLLTLARFKPGLIPMVKETHRVINEIEELDGTELGLHRTGSIYLASEPEYIKELGVLAGLAVQENIQVEWLDKQSAMERLPWLNLPPDCSIAFMPADAYIDGYRLANGYLKVARSFGLEIREMTQVTGILQTAGRVTGVETAKGPVSAFMVIDAAGVWSGLLAQEIGVALPMAPVRSQYWITGLHPSFSTEQPFVILPEARAYLRPEPGGILFGLREAQSVNVHPHSLPNSMQSYQFKQDPHGWESLLEGLPALAKFFPALEEIEIAHYIAGFSTYTPDGMFVLGGLPGLEGFLAAAGCCGSGIAMSGGIGRSISELAMGQVPSFNLEPHRLDRFEAIDPMSVDFMRRCAQARSGKITG